jgi:para-nitrobenzyl esterase
LKKILYGFGVLLLAALAVKASAQIECSDPVNTVAGQVRGMDAETPGACVWRGVPFAAPPVLDLRWSAPRPAPAWSGVREAKEFSPMCMQQVPGGLVKLESKAGMSEDCLYLNVWRPKKSGVFPVMVWIHGGGYTIGVSSTPMYWGDRLAAEGEVVVVSVNYRLNIFGFLSSPALRSEDPNKSTGNYAFLDQVAALQWVHDNIKNFGGDPANVTIFGESAGGMSVCVLYATPIAKGLYQRAIMESGGCNMSEDLEKGYENARLTTDKIGCDLEDLKCLRALPAKKILAAMPGGMAQHGNIPHNDGYVLTGTPISMIESGNYNHVPFIAGYNREEFGNMLKLYPKIKYIRPRDYEKKLRELGDFSSADAAEFVRLYPLSQYHNRPVEAYGHAFAADFIFACSTYDGLVAASRQGTPTWLYRFDYDHMRLGKYFGAAHSFEIPFVFDNFGRSPMKMFYHAQQVPPAKKLSQTIQAYWVNFARTGNPNGPGRPDWPRFSAGAPLIEVFDSEVKTENAGLVDRCAFCDKHPMKEMPNLK